MRPYLALALLVCLALGGCAMVVTVATGGATVTSTVNLTPGPLTVGVTNVAPNPGAGEAPTTRPAEEGEP